MNIINLVEGSLNIAGALISVACDGITQDKDSIDYWLSKGYFVVFCRELEVEYYDEYEYEDEVKKIKGVYSSYEEAQQEAGIFSEIACP